MFKAIISNFSEASSKHLRIAALTVFAEHKARIFEKGRKADGSSIGSYVEGPYKEQRAKRGREVGFVNLEMFGSMKRDYQVTKSGVVAYGFSRQPEADKAGFNEERYGPIFALTKAESELFTETLTALLFKGAK